TLLEVGTGFHPELTGRENVFLSGAILGMGKAEIRRKFDEIVDFAEVEKFIDTPLKHYSSGMQMRLAFAVAAHLEPEILLVDEVLSVGDIEFQKKCLGKMGDVARRGRTILFVSHQMNQMRRLCDSCCWVDQGGVRMWGKTVEVVNRYEEAGKPKLRQEETRESGSAHLAVCFVSWRIVGNSEMDVSVLKSPGPTTLCFCLLINRPIKKGIFGLTLRDSRGQINWAVAQFNLNLFPGPCEFTVNVPYFPLIPGLYYWDISVFDGHAWINEGQCAPAFAVETHDFSHPYDEFRGFLNLPYEFRMHNS
ncbi:MAG TPA: ATP-binding cassette domain-containing protein, partial [Nitrospiria bacterium]|nr:ATP-binding cassette domain-containing protein [Nitrospiria bacterium]